MVLMTHPEPLMLYKPKWAILCYLELCRTVCPSRKWNLPSADRLPLYTHRLLASNVWSVNHPFRDWHPPPDISFTRSHIPKVSTTYPMIPYKVFPLWNSKDIRIISAKERGDYSLKKRVENEKRKSHSPKVLQTRSSNKRPNFLSKCESISSIPWHSTRSKSD